MELLPILSVLLGLAEKLMPLIGNIFKAASQDKELSAAEVNKYKARIERLGKLTSGATDPAWEED